MNTHIHSILFRSSAVIGLTLLHATAHDHFAAGIVDANHNNQPDAGEALQFTGTNWANRTFHLLARPPGQRCGGHYMLDESPRTLFPLDSFSITALSDGQYEAKAPLHAHTGTWIWMEIVSVTGPQGSTFGFWEENSQVVTLSLPANQPTGNPRFVISEGMDDAGEDPQGHIHGRAWTADKAGDYQVGLRLVDLSTSGPDGGPWHTPSTIYQFQFTAGPDFQPKLEKAPGGAVTLTWPGQTGIWQGFDSSLVFTVQRSTDPASGVWQALGTRTGTTDAGQPLDAATLQFIDNSPPAGRAFYRIARGITTP